MIAKDEAQFLYDVLDYFLRNPGKSEYDFVEPPIPRKPFMDDISKAFPYDTPTGIREILGEIKSEQVTSSTLPQRVLEDLKNRNIDKNTYLEELNKQKEDLSKWKGQLKTKAAEQKTQKEVPVTESKKTAQEKIQPIQIKISQEKTAEVTVDEETLQKFVLASQMAGESEDFAESSSQVPLEAFCLGIKSSTLTEKIQIFDDGPEKNYLNYVAEYLKGLEEYFPKEAEMFSAASPIGDFEIIFPANLESPDVNSFFFSPFSQGMNTPSGEPSLFSDILGSITDEGVSKASSGLLSEVGQKVGTKVIESTAGKTFLSLLQSMGFKVGAEAATGALAGAATGAAAGTAVAPGVGTAIGAVTSFLSTYLKKIGSWITQNSENILFGAGIGGALLLMGSGAPFALSASVFGLGAFPKVANSLGTIQSGTSNALGKFQKALSFGVKSIFVPAVVAPAAITLIAFPVVVAIILFIINSGAYIVPPQYQGLGVANPYIKVEKIIKDSGTSSKSFSNSQLPKTVTYQVKITPLKGSLQNVKITYECEVLKSGVKVDCPSVSNPIPSELIQEIQPSQPFSFEYSQTYSSPTYNDSMIVDTISVSAYISSENENTLAVGSASVVIGTPPVSCPILGGRITNGSYNGTTGHGSPEYWAITGLSRYPIPQTSGCMFPSDCPYYGYAIDVFPTGSSDVFAPTVMGENLEWKFNGVFFSNGGGAVGYSYGYTDTTGRYSILFTHICLSPVTSGTVRSGEKIGTLFNQGGNTHLHLEFQANGEYKKPENYFCR